MPSPGRRTRSSILGWFANSLSLRTLRGRLHSLELIVRYLVMLLVAFVRELTGPSGLLLKEVAEAFQLLR